jgi:8-oxo-dGTP pyrophosphatase MutT (NUDIX family)
MTPTDLDVIVAAVCYRTPPGNIEFLLVRTKGGGEKWTFPKGHLLPNEVDEPSLGAAREALEEAGVLGQVDPEPFTRYRYPNTRSHQGQLDSLVEAYLLFVVSQRPVRAESFRTPRWLRPSAAIARLRAGGRETAYAEEQARVVREAVTIITRRVGPGRTRDGAMGVG